MASKKYPRLKTYRLIDQLLALRIAYPKAQCKISKGVLYWNGVITPSPLSQTYEVNMKYKLMRRPCVTVRGENLKRIDDPNFPHKYNINKEKKLVEMCLYLSPDFTSQMLLADTVIPWAVEWLYHYEIWLATGEWCGGGKHPQLNKGVKNKAAS